MEENYFIVLQLPFVVKPQFNAKYKNSFFGKGLADEAAMGKLKIISKRNDTGVSEELREHAKKTKAFTSYVLLDMKLTDTDANCEASIFRKTAKRLRKKRNQIIIDTAENFNLFALEV